MKTVLHTDEHGFTQVKLIRDDDPDDMAYAGIPVGPPDLRLLDWERITLEIQDGLAKSGLLTYNDIGRQPNGLSAVIKRVLVKYIKGLYLDHKEG